MGQLPDGTNGIGRMLDIIRAAGRTSSDDTGIVYGEYLGNKKFLVGDITLEPGDYVLLQNQIKIDGKVFNLPGLVEQKKTVKRTVTHYHYDDDSDKNHEVKESFEFDVIVPQLEKGDPVIAYQFGNEEFVIFGKVV